MKKILIVAAIAVVIGAIVVVNLMKKEKGIEVSAEKVEIGTVQQKVTGSGQIKPAIEMNRNLPKQRIINRLIETNLWPF